MVKQKAALIINNSSALIEAALPGPRRGAAEPSSPGGAAGAASPAQEAAARQSLGLKG